MHIRKPWLKLNEVIIYLYCVRKLAHTNRKSHLIRFKIAAYASVFMQNTHEVRSML